VAKKANIELSFNFMLEVDWKATIDNKVDNLVARMAKVDSMATFLAEIKAMLQARQPSKHQVDLPPKELVYETPRSITQAAK
jgi:hypothetical protein